MTIPQDSEARKLKYPLKNSFELSPFGTPQGETVAFLDLSDWPSQDSDVRVRLVFDWSLSEFVALATSLDVGRDIAYNENQGAIWYAWVRGLQSMNICSDIVDCITNDADVQLALSQFLENEGYGSGGGNGDEPTFYDDNQTMFDGSQIENCDNDNLFGAITQMVDLFNTIITDAFEGFEVSSAGYEQIATILEAIPVTNVLAIDDVIQFGNQLMENLAQNYAGAYTAALRDEYRCDIFCLVKDTCELDFQTLANYFMDRVGASITTVDYPTAISWFLTGNFLGDAVSDAAHAILLQTLAYGSKFFQVDGTWLGRAITSFGNDPDSDWLTLCECSDGEAYEVDFTTGLGEWIINTGRGILTAEGIESQVFAGDEQLQIYLIANEAFLVKNLTIEYEKTGTTSPSDYRVRIGNDVVNGGNFIITQSDPNTGTITRCNQEINNVTSATGIMIFLRNGGSGDTITLKKVKFWRDVDPLPAPLSPNAAIGCYE